MDNEPEVLWTYMWWDYEAGCYVQAGFYQTEKAAQFARETAPNNWGGPSPVYSVPCPWAKK